MTFIFQVEALDGRVIRREVQTAYAFAEFYLGALTREQQLRIKFVDPDEPDDPLATVLLRR